MVRPYIARQGSVRHVFYLLVMQGRPMGPRKRDSFVCQAAMTRRRIYVNLDELTYRGLKRLGVYSGECVGMMLERMSRELVAHRQLTDDSFYRWLEAEHRDIVYATPQDRLPPPRYRSSGINPDSDDDNWPRSPQD